MVGWGDSGRTNGVTRIDVAGGLGHAPWKFYNKKIKISLCILVTLPTQSGIYILDRILISNFHVIIVLRIGCGRGGRFEATRPPPPGYATVSIMYQVSGRTHQLLYLQQRELHADVDGVGRVDDRPC